MRDSVVTAVPLTERILAWLPGASWIWVAVWALLVLIRPVFFAQVLSLTGTPTSTWEFYLLRFPSHAVYAYMNVLCFWAVRRLARDAAALEPVLQRLAGTPAGTRPFFSGVNSTAGPLALIAALTIGNIWDIGVERGLIVPMVFLPYIVLPVIPMMALFWVYITLLLGLDAAGRRKMALGPFPEDCSLGLGPVGALAFSAFLIFCAAAVPFVLVSLRSRFDLTVGLTFFVAGVGAFFLSMWRLHRQLLEAKRRHLAWARSLYTEAYEPVRENVTLEAIRERAPLVSAAEAFEKRAGLIQEWPFDDRTMTRIVAISTGVVTAIISRMVLRSVGL